MVKELFNDLKSIPTSPQEILEVKNKDIVDMVAAITNESFQVKESSQVTTKNLENNIEIKSDNLEIKKNKNRCTSCKKKTGLTGFFCRCGSEFCGGHRHDHNCQYDYAKEGKELLEKNNQTVVKDKLERI